jgi:hypothetical protein
MKAYLVLYIVCGLVCLAPVVLSLMALWRPTVKKYMVAAVACVISLGATLLLMTLDQRLISYGVAWWMAAGFVMLLMFLSAFDLHRKERQDKV